MSKFIRETLPLLLVAGLVIALDQASKHLIRTHLALGEVYRPDLWLTQYVRILHWKNYGAAFGIFQSLGGFFTILSTLVSLAIIYYYRQVPPQERLIRLAMGLLLGGAVGNLIDRLHQGYVTDFISVGKFPVFNIADASITLGVAVLFLGMWLQERRRKAQASLGGGEIVEVASLRPPAAEEPPE